MFLSFIAFFGTLWVALGLSCSKDDARPNFLILFADDMGYGDMSIHGHPTLHTPNLDNLARQGKRLTQWYSGFHVCSPSRASLMTGRLPPRCGCAGLGTGGVFPVGANGGLPLNV